MSVLTTAEFLRSVHEVQDLPPDTGLEVAFAGRSNAGKSTALNALVARRKLAFVSRTPGRTQTINFFSCGRNERLVDLPGYGYAAVPRKEQAHWGRLISTYLQTRASLAGLVLIMDARHPLTPLDEQLIGWYAGSGKPLHALLTKSDKLTRQEADRTLKEARAALAALAPDASVQLFSGTAGTGVKPARTIISSWLRGELT